jgi:hypothetical protein
MTEHTPSTRAGLRDEIADALEAADYSGNMRRGDLADSVMPVLYRAWPWLRAEAEELEQARAEAESAAAAAGSYANGNEHAIAHPGRWLHILFTSPEEMSANTSALAIRDHLAAEFDGVRMQITTNATEAESVTVCTTACDEQHTYDWTCEQFAGIDGGEQPVRTTPDNPAASEDVADNPAATEATDTPTWTPPPPGSTREQLPPAVLALLPARDYLSTACDTGQQLTEAPTPTSGGAIPNVGWYTQMLHTRCRRNHKFTGALCICPCHQHADA